MTRVALLSEVFPPQFGGSGRWLYEMYRRLAPEHVLVLAGQAVGQRDFDASGEIATRRVPLAMPQWGLRSLEGLRGYRRAWKVIAPVVRRFQPTQVHAARCLPEGALAWWNKRRHGIPYICYAHGEELNYAAASRELGWMTRRILNGADFIVANSDNTRRILSTRWRVPDRRIHVIHPGVDCDLFHPSEDPIAKSNLGWDGRTVVLTVGRLQQRKGHDRLIEALDVIRKSIPNVLYAVLGDGEERIRLAQLAERLGVADRVQFLGEVSDEKLMSCYRQCDLFALPNRQVAEDIEGFGMVLIEAQACGKPVIAGASGGTAETMQPGVTGEVIPCETAGPLAAAVIRLLQDPVRRKAMGLAGRSWVQANFAWPVVAGKAARLFGIPLAAAVSPTAPASEQSAVGAASP
ncbi:MAG: glycosyltransferase family 4 protein [Planctomycetaceae bacterium]|nr:glycosyltransferase family 4 protein [Planctomycetaceae bacterium]